MDKSMEWCHTSKEKKVKSVSSAKKLMAIVSLGDNIDL
jgi:hypothetical protein